MKPDQKTIEAMIKNIEKYNNAKTAEEGFSALNSLISTGEDLLEKDEQVEDPEGTVSAVRAEKTDI